MSIDREKGLIKPVDWTFGDPLPVLTSATPSATALPAATPSAQVPAGLECELCSLPPEKHDYRHWCDNQSFRIVAPSSPGDVIVQFKRNGRGLTHQFELYERGWRNAEHAHGIGTAPIRGEQP